MATRTIETKAIISAEDKTGNAFSAVVQKLAKMESAAKAAKVQIGATDPRLRSSLAHGRRARARRGQGPAGDPASRHPPLRRADGRDRRRRALRHRRHPRLLQGRRILSA